MNSFQYKGVSSGTEVLFKDKGSKHFGYAFRVTSRNEVALIIDKLRQENSKANHVCHAFVIRSKNGLDEFSTDDGEPKNSAGPPILGQLKSANVENTLVAVVRYFGGTKLGVSGLINAYKTTAEMALNKATLKTFEESIQAEIIFGFDQYNWVLPAIKNIGLSIISEEHTTNCKLLIEVPLSVKGTFENKLTSKSTINITWLK